MPNRGINTYSAAAHNNIFTPAKVLFYGAAQYILAHRGLPMKLLLFSLVLVAISPLRPMSDIPYFVCTSFATAMHSSKLLAIVTHFSRQWLVNGRRIVMKSVFHSTSQSKSSFSSDEKELFD
ncbi:MAG: hypothetical protein R3C14_08105 [Caldilineaceae bacterium]